MMFKRFSLVSLSLVSLSLVLLLSACVDRPQETLRVGAVLWPGYEPLYLADKLGYYDDQPIKLIDYLSNTNTILAFKNHSLHAAAFTLDETLQLLSDGVDIDVVLIMDMSYGGDVIMANPGIDRVEDLQGKPVAVESSAVGMFVLKRALELHGMDMSDIQIVSTNAMEQASNFVHGNIVAAVSFDPYRTQLVKSGKHEIFNSTLIPNEIVDVLVVRRSYSEQYPDTVKQLVEAWFKALAYQAENPQKSAAYSLKRFNTTVEDYIASLERLKFSTKEDNRRLLDKQSSPLLEQQHMIEILDELKLIKKIPSLQNHLNGRYIPE